MTKAELVDALVKATFNGPAGRTMLKTDVEAVLHALDTVVAGALAMEESVPLAGGRLEAKKRRARMGRNPRTGEPVEIPACVVVRFQASKGLKDILNGSRA